MVKTGKLILLVFAVTFFGATAYSQSFEMTVNKDSVSLDETFVLTITVEDLDFDRVMPPNVERDFQIVGGPSISNQTTIINGVRTRAAKYIYYLQARATGTYVIKGASLGLPDGDAIQTDWIKIDVTAADGEKKRRLPRKKSKLKPKPSVRI